MPMADVNDLIDEPFDRKFYAEQFKALLDRLQRVQPPFPEAMIDTEINAYRNEIKQARAAQKSKKAENP